MPGFPARRRRQSVAKQRWTQLHALLSGMEMQRNAVITYSGMGTRELKDYVGPYGRLRVFLTRNRPVAFRYTSDGGGVEDRYYVTTAQGVRVQPLEQAAPEVRDELSRQFDAEFYFRNRAPSVRAPGQPNRRVLRSWY